jgi:hypothetical protein
MRTVKWLSCFWAAGLAGCALYPIPDDVTSIPTEEIVRHARCEIRSEIIGYLIERGVIAPSATDREIAAVVKEIKKTKNNFLAMLMGVGSAYAFEFEITEENKANAGAGFSLPFTGPVLSGGGSASIDLMRKGKRTFETGDLWDDLLINDRRCSGVRPRPGNIVYPLSGSIGVGRAVRTFIDIVEQGGELGGVKWEATDSFVDTLTFTTEVMADAKATITLAPVPHSFRIVSATAGVSGSRKDMHMLTLSLAFPHPLDSSALLANTGFKFENAPFQRPPQWRARYNLCVADGRRREDAVKLVRLEAPEVYCITFADHFEPKPGQQAGVVLLPPAQPGGRPRTAPAAVRVRPNRP